MADEQPSSSMDLRAFEATFKEHFPALCAFARKYVHDYDTATEIVHDVFVRLWDKREEIDPEKSVKSYLFTSVHNRCLNYIRDNKKFRTSEDEFERIKNRGTSDVEEAMNASELEEQISKALDELPEQCRKIFMMNRFEDMRYKQIAEKLNLSVKTVEAQMSKALRILREKLGKYMSVITGVIFWLLGQ